MRGRWWAAVVLSGLLGGMVGAAMLFVITRAVNSDGHSQPTPPSGRPQTPRGATLAGGGTVARNGLDAVGLYGLIRPSVVDIQTTTGRGRRRNQGEGSGIILDNAGHILTNQHVIDGADLITVSVATGQSYAATVLQQDTTNDLAVLAITAPVSVLHPATLGDAATLQVGEPVLAIGNPLGYEGTLTEGIVSGLDRTFDDGQGTTMAHLIQSDAAVNPGNSGGPLLDAAGAVVGINTLVDNAAGTDLFSGIGFAVSINTARDLIRQAMGSGR